VNPIRPVLDQLSREIGDLTERRGHRVEVVDMKVTDREGQLELDPPGERISCNRSCRLLQAADGWLAVNLARPEDHELVPAWLAADVGADVWAGAEAQVAGRQCAELVERAALVGLPVGRVGEVASETLEAPLLRMGSPVARDDRDLRVVDLSALWAGPLCGGILSSLGATVSKVESPERPDPTRHVMPEFSRRLNGRKMHLSYDLRSPEGRARLRSQVQRADVLITGSRPRAFAGLDLRPEDVFADNPGLVWVAITGYGWTGDGAARVAFGDDAAAAGGLLTWVGDEPRFLGDALADPITGLAAAVGALKALEAGGGYLVDVALAKMAAGAAWRLGLRA
jgi:CoA-transferase family III